MDKMQKLRHMIEHWAEHNDEHLKTYNDWAARSRGEGMEDTARALDEIARATKSLGELFRKALSTIPK